MEPFPCLVFLVDHLVSLLLKSCPVKNMVLMWCTWVILVYIMNDGSVMMWFEEHHEERNTQHTFLLEHTSELRVSLDISLVVEVINKRDVSCVKPAHHP